MTPFDLPPAIVLLSLFVLGAVLGSFLNVCIYRIPQHEELGAQLRSLWSPPSACPRCGHRIPRRDNIPIFGWMLLRGRCRFCKARISARYPLIELFNGLLFVVVYWFEVPLEWGARIQDSAVYADFGLRYAGQWSDVAVLHWRYAYHMVLLQALVAATFIDFDRMIVPDGVTLPAMVVGVLGGWAVPQVHLVPVWFQDSGYLRDVQDLLPQWFSHFVVPGDRMIGLDVPGWASQFPHLHGLSVSLAGLLVGGGVVWTVRLIGSWVLRREAMGFGDVILMAMIGSFLGWQPTIVVFFIAPVCALAVVGALWAVRRDREIPYGPYLSLATLLVILGWQQVWPMAERIFQLGPLVPVFALFAALMLVLSLFLVQMGKRLLGIPLYPPPEFADEWTSADQLAYLAGENVDRQQGRWRTGEWPGTAAGRGTVYEEHWRRGRASHGLQDGRRLG